MKQFFKIIVFLFCFSLQAQEKEKKAIDQLDSDLQSTSHENGLSAIGKEHLNLIFGDLIKKKAFSENNIKILNNYELLNEYRFTAKNYSFEVSEKADMDQKSINKVFFWRMDLNSKKAHYEFYVNQSDLKNMKYTYFFELINDKWIIKQQ